MLFAMLLLTIITLAMSWEAIRMHFMDKKSILKITGKNAINTIRKFDKTEDPDTAFDYLYENLQTLIKITAEIVLKEEDQINLIWALHWSKDNITSHTLIRKRLRHRAQACKNIFLDIVSKMAFYGEMDHEDKLSARKCFFEFEKAKTQYQIIDGLDSIGTWMRSIEAQIPSSNPENLNKLLKLHSECVNTIKNVSGAHGDEILQGMQRSNVYDIDPSFFDI